MTRLQKLSVQSFAIRNRVRDGYRRVTRRVPKRRVVTFLRERPFLSFFASLLLIFLLILLGSLLAPKPQEEVDGVEVKSVRVHSIGTGPVITTQAQVQKTGVIKIVAQTAGVVQAVNVTEGQEVTRGTTLVALSSNYQGGNAPGIQAQIAGAQYKNAQETFHTQKELIQKQREIATTGFENTNTLNDISLRSLDETRDLLDTNEAMLQTVDAQLALAEAGGDPAAIATARQAKAQLQAAVNQLRAGIRTSEYQIQEGNPPDRLATLQKDIALKQLDVQEKAITLGKEVAGLQLQLAQVQASLMNPASPSNGTVQRVHVVFGQSVTPGTLIATIFQPDHEIVAVANIPSNMSTSVSTGSTSSLILKDGTTVKLSPRFVSTEATNGQLYSILYSIPNEYASRLTDQEFITIEVPLSIPDTSSVMPLIPVDAVYKTEDAAYVFVNQNGKVASRSVEVGEIFGRYIEVVSGLQSGDMVIIDRNVVAGDSVIVTTI